MVLLIVLGAAGATIGLIRYSGSRYLAAADAERLQKDLYALSQLEWRLVAQGAPETDTSEGGSPPEGETDPSEEEAGESLAEVPDRTAALRDTLEQLRSHGASAQLETVVSATAAYLAAYETQIELIRGGNWEEAERVDEDRVDPAFEQAETAAVELLHAAQAEALRGSWIAVGLSAGSVLVCAGAVAALLRREGRGRAREQHAAAERASAARLAAMVRGASDLILVTGATGDLSYISPAAQRMLGLTAEDLHGTRLTELVHDADRSALASGLRRVADAPGGEATLEYRARHGDGSWRVLEARLHNNLADPAIAGLVWNVRDVTERRAMEQQLAHQAFHDVLTGLPNRALLSDRIAHAHARATPEGKAMAVVVVDLDDFKDINDSLGHAAGDEVITVVAARLVDAVRAGDTVARLGGDEFALLLEQISGDEEAVEVTGRAITALTEPLTVAGRAMRLTASAGITTAPAADSGSATPAGTAAGDAAGLLRDADVAMYAAKNRGKNQAALFEEPMRKFVQDRLDLSVDLREAAARGEIHVLYQPLVDLDSDEITGFEALARWHHPNRGVIPPATFIPLAEDTGMILDIGAHVLFTACVQLADWQRASGRTDLYMSVNLSGRQLVDDSLLGSVRAALARTELAPDRLVLEITETAVVEDLTTASRRLRDLRALGVRIAMDDFGTGYSSLSYLRRLPIDILKIDRSFVQDRAGRGPDLLAGVTMLGKTLGLLTLAEGIESPDELAQVRAAGCRYGQGYHFARPLTADDAARTLLPRPRHPALIT